MKTFRIVCYTLGATLIGSAILLYEFWDTLPAVVAFVLLFGGWAQR
jgi:hypothetical protein